MSDRISPERIPEFQVRESVKGITQHTFWLGKFLTLNTKRSFEINVGPDRRCINKDSLARYICEKYISDKNPLQYKKVVKQAIDTILKESPPENLDQFVKEVVLTIAGENVRAVLSEVEEARAKEYTLQDPAKYKRFNEILAQVTDLSKKEEPPSPVGEEVSISKELAVPLVIRSRALEEVIIPKLQNTNESLKNVFARLKELQSLPHALQKLVSSSSTFENYEGIVTYLNEFMKVSCDTSLASADQIVQFATDINTQREMLLKDLQTTPYEDLKKEVDDVLTLEKLHQCKEKLEHFKHISELETALALIQARNIKDPDVTSALKTAQDAVLAMKTAVDKKQSYENSLQAIKTLTHAVGLADVRALKTSFSDFGYDEETLFAALASLEDIDTKFTSVVSALKNLQLEVNPDVLLREQLIQGLLVKSQSLVQAINKEGSSAEKIEDQLQENLLILQEWIRQSREVLSSIQVSGFPLHEKYFVEEKGNCLKTLEKKMPTVDEVRDIKKVIENITAWGEVSRRREDLLKRFDALKTKAESLPIDTEIWAQDLQTKKDFEAIAADADAKTADENLQALSELEHGLTEFSKNLDQFEEKVRSKTIDVLKDRIDEMYRTICPDESKRSVLPHWNEWQKLKAQSSKTFQKGEFEELSHKLELLAQALHFPFERALEATHVEGETGIGAQAAASMKLRQLCKSLVSVLPPSPEEAQKIVEEIFTKLQGLPALVKDVMPVLLRSVPKGMHKKLFLDLVAKAILKTSTRSDVLIPKVQELQTPPSSFSEDVSSLLEKLSESLTVDLTAAFSPLDDSQLKLVLHRMMMTAHQSQGQTEDLIRQLAAEMVKDKTKESHLKVASALQELFSFFPNDSKELKEGIRTLGYTLQRRDLRTRYPADVHHPMAEVLRNLASQLSLVHDVSTGFDRTSRTTALLFHAAPDTDTEYAPKISDIEQSEVSLALGLMRLKDEVGNTNVHPIFIGTEWKFLSEDYPSFVKVLDKLSKISRDNPGVTYIPGSIGWFDPATNLCFNMLPIFENGRLVSLYSKRHEKQDMGTIADLFEVPQSDMKWAMKEERSLLDTFIRNTCLLESGQSLVVEICNDHVNNTAQEDYRRESPQGIGADIHLVIAHGSQLGLPRVAVRGGGCVGYIDHSGNGETKARRVNETKTVFTSKKDEVNTNKKPLGAFVTHQAVEKDALPVFSAKKEALFSEKQPARKPTEILEQMGISQEKRSAFVEYVKNHKAHLFSSSESLPGRFDFKDHIAQTLTDTLRRYTFADEADVTAFIGALERNDDIGEYRTAFFKVLAEFLHRPIVVYTDVESVDREVFMPDRSRPIGIPKDPLEIGFSFKTKTFSKISWESSEEYKSSKEACDKSLAEWNESLKALTETLDIDVVTKFKALEEKIKAFRETNERGSIDRQRAFSEFSEQMGLLEEQCRVEKLQAEKAVAFLEETQKALKEWEEGHALNLAAVKESHDEYYEALGEKRPIALAAQIDGILRCLCLVDVLEQFHKEKGGIGSRFRGLYLDRATKQLASSGWMLLQNTEGVADELSSAVQGVKDLFSSRTTPEGREKMIVLLEDLKNYYQKKDITTAVDSLIVALQSVR